ncbi:transporter substrate-binding domain-containing protein [Pikeienuella piscinae]|nr:transporter substrate-binding domain-containing protein [Pikeienuella piscinae]
MTFRTISRLHSTVMTAAIAFTAGGAAAETLRMGVEAAYPPFSYINDQNEVDGFEREFGDEICRRAGFDCVWVTNDWETIIPNLVSGNYDTILAAMTITPERDKVIDFSEEYYPPDPSAYIALAGAGEEVRGGVVAAAATSVQAHYIVESGATLVEFPSWDDTIAAVKNGEVDAVLADRGFLEDIVNESDDFVFVGENLTIGGGMGIGVRESDTELKAKLNTAIESMKADGALNAMIAKWFDGRDHVY